MWWRRQGLSLEVLPCLDEVLMNTVSYNLAVGTHVWFVTDPQRATERCKHCGEWTKWRPEFAVQELIVRDVHIWVENDGKTSATYGLNYDDNFTLFIHNAKENDVFLTREEAEAAVLSKQAEWDRNHGR